MKLLSLILLCLLSVGAWGQTQIFEQRIAPRADSLTGDWSPSDSGKYMISFPYPNDCLELGPIQANSRSMALYRAFSRGGFTLKHSDAGLTVWTLEEWNDLKKETWYADYEKRHAEHCAKK